MSNQEQALALIDMLTDIKSINIRERGILRRAILLPENLQGDLISRDALRKAFHERIYYFNKSSWDEANALIDTAPTIEEKSYAMGYQDGAEDGLQGIRKEGKWIDHSDDYGYAECPFCHELTTCGDNIDELHYCWNCGAKLEKGGAE